MLLDPEMTKAEVARHFDVSRPTLNKALNKTETLKKSDIDLITTVRKNMKARVISAFDRAMLSKIYIIETINDQLKSISQIEHSRHRSETSFMLNLISGIVAYCLKKRKPRIKLSPCEFGLMAT